MSVVEVLPDDLPAPTGVTAASFLGIGPSEPRARPSGPRVCTECGKDAKYTCPGCQAQTCSLPCSKGHKDRTKCTGKRKRTGYVPLDAYDEATLVSDFHLLQEAGVNLSGAAGSRPPPPRRLQHLPQHVRTFLHQARLRGVEVQLQQPGMTRRRDNSSRWEGGAGKRLMWRLEWRFPGAAHHTLHSSRVSDDQIVLDLLKHHLNLTEAPGAFAEVKPLSAAGAHSSKPVTDTSVSAAEMPTGAETRNIAAGAAAEAAPGTDDTSSVSILAGQGALGTVASGVSAADSAASPVASVPVRGPGPSPAAQGGGSEPSPSPTGDPRVAGTAAEAPEWADSGGGQQSEVGEEQQSTGAERAREQVAGQGGDEAHGAAHDPLRPYRSVAPEQLEVLMRLPHTPANSPEHWRLDTTQTLQSQLAGKAVVEFPTLLVLLPHEFHSGSWALQGDNARTAAAAAVQEAEARATAAAAAKAAAERAAAAAKAAATAAGARPGAPGVRPFAASSAAAAAAATGFCGRGGGVFSRPPPTRPLAQPAAPVCGAPPLQPPQQQHHWQSQPRQQQQRQRQWQPPEQRHHHHQQQQQQQQQQPVWQMPPQQAAWQPGPAQPWVQSQGWPQQQLPPPMVLAGCTWQGVAPPLPRPPPPRAPPGAVPPGGQSVTFAGQTYMLMPDT